MDHLVEAWILMQQTAGLGLVSHIKKVACGVRKGICSCAR